MLYLICYDIVSNARRNKVASLLLDHGERIQFSTFECHIKDTPELEKLLGRLKKQVHLKEDSVRLYRLCSACNSAAIRVGVIKNPEEKSWIVG